MTKSKKLFVTTLLALSVFGVLLAASLYSEVARETILGFFSAIGYCLTVYAFYKFLGDSKQTEPYIEPVEAYDYAADETTRDIGRTVDEIIAEIEAENAE